MINEAFWFFYWISMIERLPHIFGASVIAGVLALIVYGAAAAEVSYPLGTKTFKRMGIAYIWYISILVLLLIVAPSTNALYAGAAQYGIEVTELDDTLLTLKEVVDLKVEELLPDSKGKTDE